MTSSWTRLDRPKARFSINRREFFYISVNPKHGNRKVWISGHHHLFGWCLDNDSPERHFLQLCPRLTIHVLEKAWRKCLDLLWPFPTARPLNLSADVQINNSTNMLKSDFNLSAIAQAESKISHIWASFFDIFTPPKHVKLHIWTAGQRHLFGWCFDNYSPFSKFSERHFLPLCPRLTIHIPSKWTEDIFWSFLAFLTAQPFEFERSSATKHKDKNAQKWFEFQHNWTYQKQYVAHLGVIFSMYSWARNIWSCTFELQVTTI